MAFSDSDWRALYCRALDLLEQEGIDIQGVFRSADRIQFYVARAQFRAALALLQQHLGCGSRVRHVVANDDRNVHFGKGAKRDYAQVTLVQVEDAGTPEPKFGRWLTWTSAAEVEEHDWREREWTDLALLAEHRANKEAEQKDERSLLDRIKEQAISLSKEQVEQYLATRASREAEKKERQREMVRTHEQLRRDRKKLFKFLAALPEEEQQKWLQEMQLSREGP
jgi:hypothetical protein